MIVARVLGPDQFEEVTRTGGPTNIPTIDPDVEHSYAEEWFGGVERELWPRMSVKAQYIRRNTRNTIGFVDAGSVWTPRRSSILGRTAYCRQQTTAAR